MVWPEIWPKNGECAASDIGQRALRAIQKDRNLQFVGDPRTHCVASSERIVIGRIRQWDERHNIDNADPRMDSGVGAQVKSLHCVPDDGRGSSGTNDGDHRTVVIGIAMHVEKIAAGDESNFLDKVKVAAFADVDDALNHD